MQRSKHEGSVVVYQYGTPHRADLDEEGMNQLRLANGLWNALVEIERRYDEEAKKAEEEVASLAEAEAAITVASALVAELKERKKKERIQDRSTKVRTTTATELKTAQATLDAAKEHRKNVRETEAVIRKALRSETNKARKAETGTEMYRTWMERGLGWATYNDVSQRVDTARKLIIRQRSLDDKAEFHFHKWNGEGTLSVQCQQTAGKERRVEWEIIGAHPKHKTLRLRIGRTRELGSHWLEIPFVYHRPLPVSAQDVTDVRVTRRVLGGKAKLTIQFSCRVPSVTMREQGASVAIGIGWKRDEGTIRVARVASSAPLPPVPGDLKPAVKVVGERHAYVVLPASCEFALSRDEDIQSIRDKSLEELRPHVVAAMEDSAISELANGDPSRWRSQARFASLTRRIPTTHPLHETMEYWRKRDKHLWLYEANERDQTIARRRDTWRKVAAWLATGAQVFALSDVDYGEIKQKRTDAEDTFEQRGSRKLLQMAAPGELRLYLEQAAAKNGIQVVNM